MRRRISAHDAGITGSSSTAAMRTASATSDSTCVSRSAAPCLASVHGSVSAMNSLVASTSPNAADAASCSA